MNFKKNNLDFSTSPYLNQHKDNPIHWQEWSKEVLEYAKKKNKPLFVSVGYATCHWCHVMAREAFSNQEIADYLNKYFVAIKVDREQRLDIDQYLMSYITQSTGHGGWPLNAFLTPDFRPIIAVTYMPVQPMHGYPSFLSLLQQVHHSFEKNNDKLLPFLPQKNKKPTVEEEELLAGIQHAVDYNGTIGGTPKFPPHNTLLFLLSYYEKTKDRDVKEMLEKTLEVMAKRGLHDHLQGGFYRYCVDNEWTIPHFEKMLYDQAMLLWVYSVAYKLFKEDSYKQIAEKIMVCLKETFEEKGLYYSAHDADTNHEEGTTYIWDEAEIQDNLSDNEFERFAFIYEMHENFEEKIHLIKKRNLFLPEVEQKLLTLRKKREQPFADKKFITSWNALTGIAYIMAFRYLNNQEALTKAKTIFKKLKKLHYGDGKLIHSSLGTNLQEDEFLEDYATTLLLATYLYEEEIIPKEEMIQLKKEALKFNTTEWVESNNKDFIEISAKEYDHPIPSSVSLIKLALLRVAILTNDSYSEGEYKYPLEFDFYNYMTFIKNGKWHIIHTPKKVDWEKLPLNTIQIKGKKIQDCYNKECKLFTSQDALLLSF